MIWRLRPHYENPVPYLTREGAGRAGLGVGLVPTRSKETRSVAEGPSRPASLEDTDPDLWPGTRPKNNLTKRRYNPGNG